MLELSMGEKLLTVEEVARRLATTEASVRRWLRNGELEGIQVGDQWRVEPAALERYIEERRNRPKKEESR